MKVHVNTSWDISVGISVHGWWQIPPVPPPPGPELSCPKLPALEIPIPMAWPIGIGMGTVKKTTTVKHRGNDVILDGHDCGLLIPQITLNPINIWFPLMLFTSKRKTVFSAFTVRMNGKPTAVASPIFFPMLTCGSPVSIPLTLPVTNLGNTAKVGVTLADIVGGILTIAFTIGLDALFNKMSFQPINPAANLPKEILKDVARENMNRALKKAALSSLAGFTTSAVQHAIDSRYPYKLDFNVPIGGSRVTLGVRGQAGSSDTTNNPTRIGVNATVDLVRSNRGPMQFNGTRARSTTIQATGSVTYTSDAGRNNSAEGVDAGRGTPSPSTSRGPFGYAL